MQWLLSRVARHPRHAIVLGKTLLLAGSILIVTAVFARAALVNANADRAQAKLAPLHAVAQLYPDFPTWIVPEGPVGFAISAALVLAGLGLTLLAEKAGKRR